VDDVLGLANVRQAKAGVYEDVAEVKSLESRAVDYLVLNDYL
jgi:hypothetical protein